MNRKSLIFLIIFYLSSKYLILSEYSPKNNNNLISFCGVDKIKSNILTYNLTKEQKRNISKFKKRNLDEDNYESIRLYLSETYLNYQIETILPNLELNGANLPIILKEVKNYIQKLIKVKRLNYSIKVSKEIFTSNKIEDHQDDILINTGIFCDLVIIPKIIIDETIYSNNVLKDESNNRTIVSFLLIPQKYAKFNNDIEKHLYKIIILHEITHILGFLYDSFQYFKGGLEGTIKKQKDSRGINRTYIITPTVIDLAKKYYNCNNITGIELENQNSDEDYQSSHWEARILLGDYMNSILYYPEIVISEFTLALLKDSGWYEINYYTGGLMRFGKNKGCKFLYNDCCDNHGRTEFKNEFFDLEDNNNPSCSSGRLSRTYNNYFKYSQSDISFYREFEDNNNNILGGKTKNADYCFGFNNNEDESKNNIFVGNCKIGSGIYGSEIIFNDNNKYKNSDFENKLFESYSNNSFCILSEAYPKNDIDKNIFNSIIHPICYEMFCSNYSLTIKIKDQYIVCPRKGGKVEINGDFQGFLYCPDYNLICTGIRMCNDIFDCIENNSSFINNSIYDYDFNIEKTSSQKISEIRNENISIHGDEINEEGICPENCIQCRDIKRCFKCIEGYKLLGKKDNDSLPIICDKNTNVSIGYYINNEVYYPCIEFCIECDSSYTCLKCDNIHKKNDDRTECIDKVANCENYTNDNFTCIKCKGEYVFIGNDRDNCYIINDKSKYYTLDEGISYFPCNTTILNCEICNNNKDICNKCQENYYLIKDNKTFCFNDKNLSKYYTEDNGVTYFFCNDSIPFCDTCNESNICQTCGENYYFIKENRTHCLTGYDLKKYYSEDNYISYYPCKEVMNKCIECNKINE